MNALKSAILPPLYESAERVLPAIINSEESHYHHTSETGWRCDGIFFRAISFFTIIGPYSKSHLTN